MYSKSDTHFSMPVNNRDKDRSIVKRRQIKRKVERRNQKKSLLCCAGRYHSQVSPASHFLSLSFFFFGMAVKS